MRLQNNAYSKPLVAFSALVYLNHPDLQSNQDTQVLARARHLNACSIRTGNGKLLLDSVLPAYAFFFPACAACLLAAFF